MLTHPVLHQLATSGIKLGVDRVRRFLTHLGDPHLAFPVVHVAGTNGKGSVCAMVSQALIEAGYRVGTYTSPHLEHVNERMCINGIPISDDELSRAIDELDRERWDWVRLNEASTAMLTYYEFVTMLAFRYFAMSNVDVAVIEVGMGGRLDATNVVQPLVSAITSISLDHEEVLGDTVDKIALEKAGIIKSGVPVIVGALPESARAVVERVAKSRNAPMWRPGPQMAKEYRKGQWGFRTPEGSVNGVNLRMEGTHQAGNALVAVGILLCLRAQGFSLGDEAVRNGLSKAYLAGRIEEIRPGLIVDGAHNPASVNALADWLSKRPKVENRILLWGMGGGRNPVKLIEALIPWVDEVVTTRCAHPKAMDPMDIAVTLREHYDVELAAADSIDEALAEVYREASETVVAGSLYLAGAARSLVRAGVLDGLEPGQGPEEE